MMLLMAIGLANASIPTENLIKVRQLAEVVCPYGDPDYADRSAQRFGFNLVERYMLNSMCLLYSRGKADGLQQVEDILTKPR